MFNLLGIMPLQQMGAKETQIRFKMQKDGEPVWDHVTTDSRQAEVIEGRERGSRDYVSLASSAATSCKASHSSGVNTGICEV